MQGTQVWSMGWKDSPGEVNGNPLQYSCLENPMGRGAWRATVHGVAKSQTQLNELTFSLFHFMQNSSPLKRTSVCFPSRPSPFLPRHVANQTSSHSVSEVPTSNQLSDSSPCRICLLHPWAPSRGSQLHLTHYQFTQYWRFLELLPWAQFQILLPSQ